MSSSQSSKTKTVLRWVAFLPVSALSAWLAWLFVMIGNRLTLGMRGFNPDDFLFRTFIEFISSAAMGAAFVYAGAKVAPTHHKTVAYVLAAIGLVAAGFMLFPNFMIHDYWAVWASFSFAAGLGLTAYSVSTGEIAVET